MNRTTAKHPDATDRADGPASTRRAFLSAAASLFTGSLCCWQPFSLSRAAAQSPPLGGLPVLDGNVLLDAQSREAVAVDWGFHIRRVPLAVARPKSVEDIARIIRYANDRGLKVAMRGQGHCVYGQAQAEGGIVIDTSTLNGVRLLDNGTLETAPGAQWGDVAKASLAHGLTPPVMVDAMMLTVGGTLSVGGTGETSHRFGAQVDHVIEADVVTGSGELVTCSAERNSDLFEMTLAGLGQCGAIVRARLRLITAPQYVLTRTFTYNDMEEFLADQTQLSATEGVGPLNGRITREQDGTMKFMLSVVTFGLNVEEASRTPGWMSGLRHKAETSAPAQSYWDYLNRRTASINVGKTRKTPNPALVATLPASAVAAFLRHVLFAPEAYAGIWFFEVSPKVTARHTRPLQKMPSEPLAFELRIQRRASAAGAPDHGAMIAANYDLIPRLQAAGGKIYPPFAPILPRDGWQEHYGREIWQRFAAAKERFDPNSVLNPGAGIF